MPSAKKERSRKKKQVATAPRRSLTPALCAAAARIEAANAVSDLSTGMQAFLAIDLPTPRKAKEGSDADEILRECFIFPSCEAHKCNDPSLPKSRCVCVWSSLSAGHQLGKSTKPEDPSVGTVVEPVHLEIRASTSISRVDSDRMYDLLKANMYDLYALAGWDWDERKKRREMEHRQARLLIARCKGTTGKEPSTKVSDWVPDGDETVAKGPEMEPMTTGLSAPGGGDIVAGAKSMTGEGDNGGRLAGFCDFRFCWDEDENEDGQGVGASNDVLYVYEIQVAPWARQRGLGQRMMQVLELLANKHGMSKVMLTVFKANKQAMSFYTKKMKYEIDDDSPSNWDRPDEVYEILSKPTRHGAARASKARKSSTLLG